jgi:COMPASS component SWD3
MQSAVSDIRNFNEIKTQGPQRISQPQQGLRKISPKMTIGDGDTQVFSMKFDAKDEYLACGYGDGMTRIYNTDSGKLSYTLADYNSDTAMPVTCLLWRPMSSTVKTANMLVTGHADGYLRHWHTTSGKCLH